jgi:Ca2+-binding EF-hand superfamily protein
MDTNDDGKVDREDFILFMLVALQKVDKSTINELKTIFGSLDKNGNGLLEEDDLIELAEENYLPTLQRIRKELHSLSDLDERLLRDLAEAPVPILPDHQDQNGKHRRVHSIF